MKNPCTEIAEVTRAVLGEQATVAEYLLETARATSRPKGKLIRLYGPLDSLLVARIIFAHDFARLPASTHLRAIVEGWTHQRILQETY